MPEYQKFLKAQTSGWHMPFDPVSNPDHMAFLKRYDLGRQLRAGFELLDVYQDTNNTGPLRKYDAPTFWATPARKIQLV